METPHFKFENYLWRMNFDFVAGMDEVGRGSFAGPVVCAAVVFPKNKIINSSNYFIPDYIEINDSKKLTDKKRRIADRWIKDNCMGWGVGVGSVAEINRLGIVKVTHSGFRRALLNLNRSLVHRVDYLLIDGYCIPYIRGYRIPDKRKRKLVKSSNLRKLIGNKESQFALIKGDQKSLSIAAASIIAKVYRDDLLIRMSDKFKKYGWDKNKGYGTKKHINAITQHGLTKHHRKSFIHFI